MPHIWEQHPSEETLEAYALGDLSEADCERVDYHLMLCERCRQRVQVLDGFLTAMNDTVVRPATKPEPPAGERIAHSPGKPYDPGR
ncbi:MAG: zf-HC2 domain-containing protein [Bryobacterales bacterium]|nr:zf-HC2 domain-containing protein [Bryobacterales bacterium]